MHQRHMEYHAASSTSRREALFPAYSRAKLEYYLAAERMRQANDRVRAAQSTFQKAESEWKRLGVVLAQYKVDAGREYSFRENVEFCQANGCAPGFLSGATDRFHVFQPDALRMINAGAAYDAGLTGKGVRVGIEDDTVNVFLGEFEGRVDLSPPARLTYLYPGGTDFGSSARSCERLSPSARRARKCAVYDFDPDRDGTASLRVAQLHVQGLLRPGDTVFLRNLQADPDDPLESDFVYHVVATPSPGRSHGTKVASTALGRDFGVASGATLVPLAYPLGLADSRYKPHSLAFAAELLAQSPLRIGAALAPAEWRELDLTMAAYQKVYYVGLDVINQSYGIDALPLPGAVAGSRDVQQARDLQRLLPNWWTAYTQQDRPASQRTVIVRAAGNQGLLAPTLDSAYPFSFPEMRGHHLTVVSVDPVTGGIADYSNKCGLLPPNWNRFRSGRHYCLAAPGTVNAVDYDGKVSEESHEIVGTSFAAPVVTGSIALLMEHFRTGRGGLGNTAIVRRVIDTANNRGHYAESEVYGAGLLDLRAALSPVGYLRTGTATRSAATAHTLVSIPAAAGDLGRRFAAEGIEIASVDTWGAPFWSDPRHSILQTAVGLDPIPTIATPGSVPPDRLHLGFTPGTFATAANPAGPHFLAGPGRIGFEYAPVRGWRWGVLGDGESWQGGSASGAFGQSTRAFTVWTGRSFARDLSSGWRIRGSVTAALGQPFHESDGMLEVGLHAMSAWDVGIERGARNDDAWSHLALSQPPRAESGHATLRYLWGLENGVPAYRSARADLAPDGREIRLSWTHERDIFGGRGAASLVRAWNHGHRPGSTDTGIGFAWRYRW